MTTEQANTEAFRLNLAGHVVLVTGAATGIGRATALACGRAGATVAVNHLGRAAEAEAVVAQLRSQRDRAWDAIDEAEARLDEIEAARRTLEKRGMTGILAIVEERRAGVSPALRNYLAKLLEM